MSVHKISMGFMLNKNLTPSKRYCQKNSLLIEESIDRSSLKIKLILKANRTILWMNTMKKAKLKVIQAGREIKVLTPVKDQLFQGDQKFQKKVAFKKCDLSINIELLLDFDILIKNSIFQRKNLFLGKNFVKAGDL